MDERCETCRFWNPGSPWNFKEDDMTKKEKAFETYGACLLAESEGGMPKDDKVPLAFALDGEDYRANLFTSPQFGCVQHQPKTREDRPQ